LIGSLWGTVGLAGATTTIFVVGWWAAAELAKTSGARDPAAVVIDEVAGQWLALLPAPLNPFCYAVAFLLFRAFDIWKPWPVGLADRRVHGGFGIMLDDLLAAGYAALTLSVLLVIGGALGVRL
jgi:phosphatidylglycerophosphatase A